MHFQMPRFFASESEKRPMRPGKGVHMDFSSPSVLFSGLLISAIGMGMFIYGKKSQDVKSLGLGVAMCAFPYFVSSLLLMWALAGLCLAGAYFLPRFE